MLCRVQVAPYHSQSHTQAALTGAFDAQPWGYHCHCTHLAYAENPLMMMMMIIITTVIIIVIIITFTIIVISYYMFRKAQQAQHAHSLEVRHRLVSSSSWPEWLLSWD